MIARTGARPARLFAYAVWVGTGASTLPPGPGELHGGGGVGAAVLFQHLLGAVGCFYLPVVVTVNRVQVSVSGSRIRSRQGWPAFDRSVSQGRPSMSSAISPS